MSYEKSQSFPRSSSSSKTLSWKINLCLHSAANGELKDCFARC